MAEQRSKDNEVRVDDDDDDDDDEDDEDESRQCFVRRHADGKLAILSEGDPKYVEIANKSFGKSVNVFAKFDEAKFREEMKAAEVPEEAVEEFLKNFHMNDETYVYEKPYF